MTRLIRKHFLRAGGDIDGIRLYPLMAVWITPHTRRADRGETRAMEKINVGTYRVKPHETVRVEVSAVKVANLESYVLDEEVLDPVSDDPRAYEFEVTVAPGSSHLTTMTGFFPDDAPDDARYELFISGDMDGGTFTGPLIKKTDLSMDCNITFRCKQ